MRIILHAFVFVRKRNLKAQGQFACTPTAATVSEKTDPKLFIATSFIYFLTVDMALCLLVTALHVCSTWKVSWILQEPDSNACRYSVSLDS